MKIALVAVMAVLIAFTFVVPAFAAETQLEQIGHYASDSGKRLMTGLFDLAAAALKFPVTFADNSYTEWGKLTNETANQAGEKARDGGWEVLTFACPKYHTE